jgi:adenylate cyclase
MSGDDPGPPGRAPGSGPRPAGVVRPGTLAAPAETDRAAALARVRAHLLEAGATEEEIDRAVAEDVVDLLTVDRLLVPAARRYTRDDVAETTGMPVDLLKRFWRALGFLDVGDHERAFTDLDIEAVQLFQALLAVGVADVDTALQMARVIGSSMARIAEAEVAPGSMATGSAEDSVLAADAFASVADATVPAMGRLLEFVWRRHVQAATRRTMLLRIHGTAAGASPVLAVGFADMVGFTLLSQHLTEDELAAVVRRFEELSHDIVTGLGGRVVKMIGDEVMFVVDSVAAAARIGITLAEAYADDELLSDVRVGLAVGPVLIRDGDYYGPTVNLAARIVNIGNPGTVLMSDEFHLALTEVAGDEFTGQPLRPRYLKDLGRVQLWWLGRAGHEIDGAGSVADRRRNVRWERLAEVLHDLEDFREAGERLLHGGRRVVPNAGAARLAGADRGATSSASVEADGGDAEGAEGEGVVEGPDRPAP